jgi:hypothetical protein
MPPQTELDIRRVPFSRYGAYVSLTAGEAGKKPLTIHYVR